MGQIIQTKTEYEASIKAIKARLLQEARAGNIRKLDEQDYRKFRASFKPGLPRGSVAQTRCARREVKRQIAEEIKQRRRQG